MTGILLFIFYFICLTAILRKVMRKKLPELSGGQVIVIFLFKVFFGCVYGWVFLHFYHGDDSWQFFRESLVEKRNLFDHPRAFWQDFLPHAAFAKAHGFKEAIAYYVVDLEYYSMVKMLAFFDLLGFSNYYIDTLFFDFVTVWGSFALFKLLLRSFPSRRHLLIIVIFFIPTITFWISGIRAEGLLLLFLATALYYTNKWFEKKRPVYFLFIILGLAGFLIYRVTFFAVLVPAFFAWTLSLAKPQKALRRFISVYACCLVVVLVSTQMATSYNLARPLVDWRNQFIQLRGNTRFEMRDVQANAVSLIAALPEAFAHVFLRPWIWEAKGILQILTALSIMAGWILVALVFVYPRKDSKQILLHPLILLFLFYGFSQVLLLGYTVPFAGALVRYKSIPGLLLTIALTLLIDWRRLYIKIK